MKQRSQRYPIGTSPSSRRATVLHGSKSVAQRGQQSCPRLMLGRNSSASSCDKTPTPGGFRLRPSRPHVQSLFHCIPVARQWRGVKRLCLIYSSSRGGLKGNLHLAYPSLSVAFRNHSFWHGLLKV